MDDNNKGGRGTRDYNIWNYSGIKTGMTIKFPTWKKASKDPFKYNLRWSNMSMESKAFLIL